MRVLIYYVFNHDYLFLNLLGGADSEGTGDQSPLARARIRS